MKKSRKFLIAGVHNKLIIRFYTHSLALWRRVGNLQSSRTDKLSVKMCVCVWNKEEARERRLKNEFFSSLMHFFHFFFFCAAHFLKWFFCFIFYDHCEQCINGALMTNDGHSKVNNVVVHMTLIFFERRSKIWVGIFFVV